ncbi:hypothetical protein F6X68_22775, partial [Micromonospora sp. AMSO12t]
MAEQEVPAEPVDHGSAPDRSGAGAPHPLTSVGAPTPATADGAAGPSGSSTEPPSDDVRRQPDAPARGRVSVATAAAPGGSEAVPPTGPSAGTTYRAAGTGAPAATPVPGQRGTAGARASAAVPGMRRISADEAGAIRSRTGEARIYRAAPVNP